MIKIVLTNKSFQWQKCLLHLFWNLAHPSGLDLVYAWFNITRGYSFNKLSKLPKLYTLISVLNHVCDAYNTLQPYNKEPLLLQACQAAATVRLSGRSLSDISSCLCLCQHLHRYSPGVPPQDVLAMKKKTSGWKHRITCVNATIVATTIV